MVLDKPEAAGTLVEPLANHTNPAVPAAMETDEKALIEASRNGDRDAFGIIVNRYMPKALAFARQMTGDADAARDVAQDAFFKAYRALGSFRGESGFYTWFFRLLSNVCTDHLRKGSVLKKFFVFRRDTGEDEEGFDPVQNAAEERTGAIPDAALEQRELGEALARAIGRLPERQRAVFVLKHHEGMKITEIAAVLGISEGAVKSHLVRAVTALKKHMKAYVDNG